VNSGANSNLAIASEGTPPYTYAITSGVLPAGVTLNPSTGALAGIPAASAAGTYLVTVTAKDLAALPITGTASFTLTVAGGLVVSGVAPATQTYGTPNATLLSASAAGGISPYTYTLTLPATPPTGMTIASGTLGVVGITGTTKAGLYHSDVHAIDSTAVTPLAGDLLFDVLINLNVTDNGLVAASNGVASTITTVQAAGLTGTATYTLDPVSAALGWITIDQNTGVVAVTIGCPPSTTQPVVVTATDSVAGTGSAAVATGTIAFSVVVN
jgi:hypothetical protein